MKSKILALDTECTGLDLYHGALPYCVTLCDEDGEVSCWEWDVDPMTRQPIITSETLQDVVDITYLIDGADRLVLQNSKFDYTALKALCEFSDVEMGWDWAKVEDTLIAGHLLASNQPHDLTSMTLHYLGVDIEPYEVALHKETEAARRMVRNKKLGWRIASNELPEMPTAKGSLWKADGWLLRALGTHLEHPEDHEWYSLLREYANADSAATMALWCVQEELLRYRGLWAIYRARMEVLPVAVGMEATGVTVSGTRLSELEQKCQEESTGLNRVCTDIAMDLGVEDFALPRTGSSQALNSFIFNTLALKPLKRSKKTGNPSASKDVLAVYEAELQEGTPASAFIKSLIAKRKRDTALTYLAGYKRYWLKSEEHNEYYVLHPSLNMCGTWTLRWSSSNPNEQNISKQEGLNLRYAFGPAPGREWWSLDAQNIELRIPAYEAGEEEMIRLFEAPDEPPYYGSNHLLSFSAVYPDIWSEVLKEVGIDKVGPTCKKRYASTYYQWCKNGNFAVQYGAIDKAGGTGTADRAFHRAGSHARLKERFTAMHGRGGLNERCIRHAEKYGYIETLPDRTVDPDRGYPLLCTRTEQGRILPTVPLNYRVQGTACWWMARAMVRCQAKLAEWNKREGENLYRIVLQVHDELVFDFPKSRTHPSKDIGKFRLSNLWRIRILQGIMAQGGQDLIPAIPTPIGCEYHDTHWGEGVTL